MSSRAEGGPGGGGRARTHTQVPRYARDDMKRVLVANRGEIAVRIARACRESKIESVLAYSEGDDTRYLRRFFDDVLPIASYLDVGAVIDAARRSGADAIHPGYGFLS